MLLDKVFKGRFTYFVLAWDLQSRVWGKTYVQFFLLGIVSLGSRM